MPVSLILGVKNTVQQESLTQFWSGRSQLDQYVFIEAFKKQASFHCRQMPRAASSLVDPIHRILSAFIQLPYSISVIGLKIV